MISDFSVLSKFSLEELYINQKKSTREIAKLFQISQSRVFKSLQLFNIPRRSYKENKMPVEKGGTLSEAHKANIAKAAEGQNRKDPITGLGFNFRQVNLNCNECGIQILRPPRFATHKLVFCNQQCANKYITYRQKERVAVLCAECGKTLERIPSQVKERSFCNQKCAGIWKCKNITGNKVYNYKGGYDDDYGPSWPFARRQTLERDGHKCTICGVTKEQLGKEPDVHHVIPFRFFGKERHKQANNIVNLTCLCPKHHTEQEIKDNTLAEHYSNIVRGIHIISHDALSI